MPTDRFRIELGDRPAPHSEIEVSREPRVDIVILGDFRAVSPGGATSRTEDTIGSLVRVNADAVERALASFAPRLHVTLGENDGVELTFQELEDFHPDRLLERVPALASLRSVRTRAERSSEPSDVLRAAAGLAARGTSSTAPAPAPKVVRPPSGSVLDWILEDQPAAPKVEGDLDRFVADVVAPHLVPEPDQDRESLLSELDEALSRVMRGVLQDSAFRSLEALWRATTLLMQRLETGPSLHVHLLQASRSALLADLRAAGDPRRSQLARTLRALPHENSPPLLLADLAFGPNDGDLELLAGLAVLAHDVEGLLVGGAAAGLAGVGGRAEPEASWDIHPWSHDAWLAFRGSPEADSVCLALPAILLRSAYGQGADAIEGFAFEEMTVPPARERLLWGNPAFALGVLLGEALGSRGWPLQLGARLEVDGLPVHAWRNDDETGLVPCTEWTVRDDVAKELRSAGLSVFMPTGHGDIARLRSFRTLGLS
jgi:type VI secretion system protein ImpC